MLLADRISLATEVVTDHTPEYLVTISTLLLVIVTAITVFYMVKEDRRRKADLAAANQIASNENHRHEETIVAGGQDIERRLVDVVHELVKAELTEQANHLTKDDEVKDTK
jgi:hypothetical protein